MGYFVHHAIIVTACVSVQNKQHIRNIHAEAQKIIESISSDQVEFLTPLVHGSNGYWSFAFLPNGGKVGAGASIGYAIRNALIQMLSGHIEQGDSLHYAEVQFGDDNGDDRLLRHSDTYGNRLS